MIADVSSDHQLLWWITLGLGVVIASAVVLLLGFLVILVKDVQSGVEAAWDEARGVATQTATTWMLEETVKLAGALRDETKLHADLLTTAAGGQQ
ncbi:MAG TPA: hypothetical protein VM390_09600 [Acidimicrobiales bacterium]|jgi:hypothetical protein|nr:hypothetical protein [Acidimicrobiales bacterium]